MAVKGMLGMMRYCPHCVSHSTLKWAVLQGRFLIFGSGMGPMGAPSGGSGSVNFFIWMKTLVVFPARMETFFLQTSQPVLNPQTVIVPALRASCRGVAQIWLLMDTSIFGGEEVMIRLGLDRVSARQKEDRHRVRKTTAVCVFFTSNTPRIVLCYSNDTLNRT